MSDVFYWNCYFMKIDMSSKNRPLANTLANKNTKVQLYGIIKQ